jgi:Tol biopolymer transport system component
MPKSPRDFNQYVFLFSLFSLASCADNSSTSSIDVSPSIDITPSAATISVGLTQQFSATIKDKSGNLVSGLPLSWMSNDPSIAIADVNGLATGVGVGSVQIAVTDGGDLRDEITLTVLAASPREEEDSGPSDLPPTDSTPPSAGVPSMPTGLSATPGNQSITLEWSPNPASENVGGYRIYMAEEPWSTWSNLLPGAMRHEGLSCCTYLHTDLVKGKSYYFAVAAVNGSGEGAQSDSVSAAPGLRSIQRASLSTLGAEGDDVSFRPVISGNGRYVVFQSDAATLVAGDSNLRRDVFVRDLETGITQRVSVASNGIEGDQDSFSPWTNEEGRYVVYWSDATNLVPNDTNGISDVFLHDNQTGLTTRVSVDSSGNEARNTCGLSTCGSFHPSISAGGKHISFRSYADNLVAGDTNGLRDIFVRDLTTGTVTRASVSSTGIEGNGNPDISILSSDGRYVTFDSHASNLVSNDQNGAGGWGKDIFVHDNLVGTTIRVSVDPNGNDAMALDSLGRRGATSERPSISADGRYVAYYSDGTNIVAGDSNNAIDIFVYDMQTATTQRASVSSGGVQGDRRSYRPSISGDGRFVVFASDATNLVSGDNNNTQDIFIHDLQTGTTVRVSVDADGNEANGSNDDPSISKDGRYIAFGSSASNLIGPGDQNGSADVYVVPNPLFP